MSLSLTKEIIRRMNNWLRDESSGHDPVLIHDLAWLIETAKKSIQDQNHTKGKIANDCNLDTDPGEQARALHRVVRAMHDGHCPKCGHLGQSDSFYNQPKLTLDFNPKEQLIKPADSFHKCPACSFTITEEESRKALNAFRPFLQESTKMFEKWRKAQEAWDVDADSPV